MEVEECMRRKTINKQPKGGSLRELLTKAVWITDTSFSSQLAAADTAWGLQSLCR
jgi:hypothetical protein